MVPYSPLGRGFFGCKGVGESLPPNSFLVRNHNLGFKRKTSRKTKFCTLKWRSWLQNMDAPGHSWHLLGYSIKVMASHLSPGRLGLKISTRTKNLDNNVGAFRVKLGKEDVNEVCDLVVGRMS